MTVKPCRHLSSLSLGKLTDKLECTAPLNLKTCSSCKIELGTGSAMYTCLSCIETFCDTGNHFLQHSRTRNHPLFYTVNEDANRCEASENIVEDAFYCALCGGRPRLREPGKKERTSLEKIVGLIQLNQNNTHIQDLSTTKVTIINDNAHTIAQAQTQNFVTPVPKGIVNLGNTCFMNSALQLLAATLHRHGPLKSTNNSAIWNSLNYHLEEIYSKNSVTGKKNKKSNDSSSLSVNPREFLSLLCGKQKKFASMQQQDTHDFLRLLFNSIPESTNSYKSSPQVELFGGEFVSRVVCDRCRRVSDLTEPFLDISLSLQSSSSSSSIEDSISNMSLVDSCDLVKLLRDWNKKVVLEGENGYYCESCSPKDSDSLQRATLQFSFTQMPRFLILHLQRFKTSLRATGKKKAMVMEIEKDDRTVSFPLSLNIPSECFLSPTDSQEDPILYQLYGYIIHEGSTTSSGHYTAVVSPSSQSDRWYYISDTRVKEISKGKALDGESYTPYLLFYGKINK